MSVADPRLQAAYVVRTAPWWRESGAVVVSVEKRLSRPAQWLQRLARGPSRINVKLDALGTRAHELADGRRRVREIGEIMRREFGAVAEPVAPRLSEHFVRLARLGGISLLEGPGPSAREVAPARVACPRCGRATGVLAPAARYRCPSCQRVVRGALFK